MKYRILVPLLLVLVGWTCHESTYAQEQASLQDQIDEVATFSDENDNRLKAISFFANIADDEKLLYLDRQWQNGIILTTDGTKLFFTGRFEVLNQGVEVRINGQIHVLSVAYVSLVKIGNSIFIPVKRQQIEGVYKDIYAELLFNGKSNKLFAYYETQTKTVTQGISNSAPGETSLFFRERFFYSEDLETFMALPSKKKMVDRLFSSHSAKISAYMKENKLKRTKQDLMQLFYYYDELNGGGE